MKSQIGTGEGRERKSVCLVEMNDVRVLYCGNAHSSIRVHFLPQFIVT